MAIPNFSFTESTMACERRITSHPVAPPQLTRTNACLLCTPARPIVFPFHPQRSMSHPAGTFTQPRQQGKKANRDNSASTPQTEKQE